MVAEYGRRTLREEGRRCRGPPCASRETDGRPSRAHPGGGASARADAARSGRRAGTGRGCDAAAAGGDLPVPVGPRRAPAPPRRLGVDAGAGAVSRRLRQPHAALPPAQRSRPDGLWTLVWTCALAVLATGPLTRRRALVAGPHEYAPGPGGRAHRGDLGASRGTRLLPLPRGPVAAFTTRPGAAAPRGAPRAGVSARPPVPASRRPSARAPADAGRTPAARGRAARGRARRATRRRAGSPPDRLRPVRS